MTDPVVIGRRALLGASLVAPVALARASTLSAATNLNPGLDDLQAKIAAHGQREAEWLTYRDDVFNPMENAHKEGRQAIGERRTTLTYLTKGGRHASLSTADWSLGAARTLVAEHAPGAPDFLAVMRELVAIHEQREREYEALEARLGMAEIEQREAELTDAYVATANDVVNHPSTTHAELLAKLAFVLKHDWWEVGDTEAGVRADVERLAGETVQ